MHHRDQAISEPRVFGRHLSDVLARAVACPDFEEGRTLLARVLTHARSEGLCDCAEVTLKRLVARASAGNSAFAVLRKGVVRRDGDETRDPYSPSRAMNASRESRAIDRSAIEAIIADDFGCPQGCATAEVTRALLPLLGSPDSRLREGALEILYHWGVAGRYADDELLAIGHMMTRNLSARLGESGTDSVFLRSFSALILEMVIQIDDVRSLRAGGGGEPFLSHGQVLEWFEAALAAFTAEEDCRGFVDGRGWAHAIAHMADLLGTLARGRHLDTPRLERILTAIADKLARPAEIILAFDEEHRLVRAVGHVLLRNEVQSDSLHAWIAQLSHMPDGRTWGTALGLHECDQAANRARVNVRNFLRSLYFVLLWGMRGPGDTALQGNPHNTYYDRPIDARDALLADTEQALRDMNRLMYKDQGTA